LHQTGYWKMRSTAAASGAEALKLLHGAAAAGDPFEVVILDLQMPEMDGLTLAQTIRADAALGKTRLVMLTSLGLRLDAEAWRGAGINAFLVKPIKQSRLFDCLGNLLAEKTDLLEGDTRASGTAGRHGRPCAINHKP